MADSKPIPVTVSEMPAIGPLAVFASGGAERQPMVPAQDLSIVDWQEDNQDQTIPKKRWFWQRDEKARTQMFDCGHRGPKHFMLRVWGRKLHISDKRRGEKCPDCSVQHVKTQVIRCCLCRFAILPGEAIAIYNADSVQTKDFEFTVIDDYAVGCMDWNCCPSGGFFAGHWTGKSVHWQYREGEETQPQKAPEDA